MATALQDPRLDAAELAARLRLTTTRLHRRLRHEADAGLSPSQLSALAVIERDGPMTLGALAEIERVAPPSITRVVAKLEGAGLVERRPDPADRRSAHVVATRAGLALVARSRQRKTAWLTGRIEGLAPAPRARLAAALEVLDALAGSDES
jgi:DNA-binding MarR family transcriptional regulator